MFVGLSAILYIISVAMVVIGGLVTSDGSQLFPSDRAIAEYISGVSLITGGAIVFGLATLILCLDRLNKTLKDQRVTPAIFADNIVETIQPSSFGGSETLEETIFKGLGAPALSSQFADFSAQKEQPELSVSAQNSSSENSSDDTDSVTEQQVMPVGKSSSAKWDGINVGYIPNPPEPVRPTTDFAPAKSSTSSADAEVFSGVGAPFKESAFGFFSYSAEPPAEELPVEAPPAKEPPVEEPSPQEPAQVDISVELETLDVQIENEPVLEEQIQEPLAVVFQPVEDVAEEITEELVQPPITQEPLTPPPAPEVLVADKPAEIIEAPTVEAEPSLAPPPAIEPPAVSVVGSYDSGGNRYVMYSDGSIEAHLPTGIRVFKSLDDLKRSIATMSSK